jgi:hypothetical protein
MRRKEYRFMYIHNISFKVQTSHFFNLKKNKLDKIPSKKTYSSTQNVELAIKQMKSQVSI